MFKLCIACCMIVLPLSAFPDWRDPTIPGNRRNSEQQNAFRQDASFKLTGILISDHGRYATINGKTVKVGHLLDSSTRIIKIMPHTVLIKHYETTQTLHLVPSAKKPLK